MLRLLPLLAFALLPAAVAAPVPRDVRPGFGAGGLVTRAELEKLQFDTRPYVPRDGRRLRAEEPEPEEKEVAKAKDGPPRPKNRYDLAVYVPWAKFREGEPMPAYFVLRNNRPNILGLESRIDFSRTIPSFDGGDASFDVRDRSTGKSVKRIMIARTNCGGGSLVDVPADGFYCQKADLNRITGAPLSPGEYEVDWHQGRLAAAPVAFTVLKADRKPEAPSRLPAVHFFHIRHKPTDDEREARRAGERPARPELVSWRECSLAYTHSASLAAALAVGQHGIYVPDVHTIPAADRLVEVSAEWKRYREGDRVAVTLRAAAPHANVRFEELPQLFLQVEARETADRENWEREAYGEGKRYARDGEPLVTPLTIEVHLPKGWRERVAAEEARVAVLVLAKPIEFPVGAGARLKVAQQDLILVRKPGEKPVPVWSGILRTEFAATPHAAPAPLPAR